VRSFFQDSDGDIWIGTRDGGCLSRFESNSGTFVNFKHDKNIPYSISDTYVLSICEAEKDSSADWHIQRGTKFILQKNRKIRET
jgi:hypothetical protein